MNGKNTSTLPEGAEKINEFDFPTNYDQSVEEAREIDEIVDSYIKVLKGKPVAKAYIVLNRETNGNEEEPFDIEVWRDRILAEIDEKRVNIISGDERASYDVELYVL